MFLNFDITKVNKKYIERHILNSISNKIKTSGGRSWASFSILFHFSIFETKNWFTRIFPFWNRNSMNDLFYSCQKSQKKIIE